MISNFVYHNQLKSKNSIFWYINFLLGNYINNRVSKKELISDLIEIGNYFGQSFVNIHNKNKKRVFLKSNKEYFTKYVQLRKIVSDQYQETFDYWSLSKLPQTNIDVLIPGLKLLRLKQRTNILIFTSNLFLISNSELIFIFHIIGELLENSYD